MMMMTNILVAVTMALIGTSTLVTARVPIMKDVEDAHSDWVSLSADGLQYQPSSSAKNPLHERHLKGVQQNFLSSIFGTEGSDGVGSMNTPFADSQQTYYASEAQAWRLLGLYVDCNYKGYDNVDYAQDGYTEDSCTRMLVWAAYIDPNYRNTGLSEYSMWDDVNQEFNSDGCSKVRCQKMDCHLDNTEFELIGIFKHPGAEEWMEQIFKHEGFCLWDSDDYYFMQNYRTVWPNVCVEGGTTDKSGNQLYYATKPLPNAEMGLGVYSNAACTKEVDPSGVDFMSLTGGLYPSGDYGDGGGSGDGDGGSAELWNQMDRWNSLLKVYTTCKPCLAHLPAYRWDQANDYTFEDDRATIEGFACYDDAGYTNVNQCMKWFMKTTLLQAHQYDLATAAYQESVNGVDLLTRRQRRGREVSSRLPGIFWFGVAYAGLAGAFLYWVLGQRRKHASGFMMKEPLIDSPPTPPLTPQDEDKQDGQGFRAMQEPTASSEEGEDDSPGVTRVLLYA